MPGVRLVQDLQRGQLAQLIARVREVVSAVLLPNWRGEDVRIPGNLEALLLDEGLALAWVPPQPVIVTTSKGRWFLFIKACRAERREMPCSL